MRPELGAQVTLSFLAHVSLFFAANQFMSSSGKFLLNIYEGEVILLLILIDYILIVFCASTFKAA